MLFFFFLADTDVKATIDGKTIKRKNDTYLLFNSIDIKVSFKDYSFIIEKLFKKDQNMSKYKPNAMSEKTISLLKSQSHRDKRVCERRLTVAF